MVVLQGNQVIFGRYGSHFNTWSTLHFYGHGVSLRVTWPAALDLSSCKHCKAKKGRLSKEKFQQYMSIPAALQPPLAGKSPTWTVDICRCCTWFTSWNWQATFFTPQHSLDSFQKSLLLSILLYSALFKVLEPRGCIDIYIHNTHLSWFKIAMDNHYVW